MNNTQFQTFFDSVCRCFGHSPTNGAGNTDSVASFPAGATPSEAVPHASPTSQHSSAKRRTNRLELKDKQWDELFEKKKMHISQEQQQQQQQQHRQPVKPTHQEDDLGVAQAVAKAKLAAQPPPRHRTKRQRTKVTREEIFRSKEEEDQKNAPRNRNQIGGNSFARMLHPSLAMCFATPIRGTEEEPEETDLKSTNSNSDSNTLNTCEDTITSTVYFENKISHLKETRPPMPLFNQFKLGTTEKDEIRNIMATDSHSSARLLRLLEEQQQTPRVDDLEESSDDSQVAVRPTRRPRGTPADVEMEDAVPDVKAVSSSTDSSRQSQQRLQIR